MGETRVDLLHLLEDLRDAYPGSIEETIVGEMVANALDSGASRIRIIVDTDESTFTLVDNGQGMRKGELARFHDLAHSAKRRGRGIGFAGVGIKLGLLISDQVSTETRRGSGAAATIWRLASRRRAPWRWSKVEGLVKGHGTAVRLHLKNPLSPLLDAPNVEQMVKTQFASLFDERFSAILENHYPLGVRFDINGLVIERPTPSALETAPLSVTLPRKRKPVALGYLMRSGSAASGRGVVITTLGKTIKAGWDWLDLAPVDADSITGIIEAPALAQCLQLNKADFIRSGAAGALFLAYRKALQEVVRHQLDEWGMTVNGRNHQRRSATRPLERDLERILPDLADAFPLLPALIERRAGGQRRLPVGDAAGLAAPLAAAGGPGGDQQGPPGREPEAPAEERAAGRKPRLQPRIAVTVGRAKRRRPAHYRLKLSLEERKGDTGLARLVGTTVLINAAHPAYLRAVASRSTQYHLALATAMALAPLVAEPPEQCAFVETFLARWSEESPLH